ncbi:hypothetical protein AWM70_20780 [Paenibacillus yonginensis]|uniref:Diguanylate cyclase n=2 Tax=Paenibacillus yonginensis TaxID=1462996 RepID=A0A1B1N5K7_9BACL|nr:hypothetical protein AWM70_20780 [Paenibacillus yonginensis]
MDLNPYVAACFIGLLVFIVVGAVVVLIKFPPFETRRETELTRAFIKETLKHYQIFVWAVDPIKGTVYFSSHASELSGLSREQVMGKPVQQTGLREAGFGGLVDLMEDAVSGEPTEVQEEVRILTPNGKKHVLQVRLSLLGGNRRGTGVYVLSAIDVTESKKIEERFRLAHEGSGAIIWESDMNTHEYTFSKRWNELMGYEERQEPYSAAELLKMIHPDDLEQADEKRQSHLSGEEAAYNAEYRMLTAHGDYRWMQAHGKVLLDSRGRRIRFAGSLIDITDRKNYELQLKASLHELEQMNRELAAMQEELKQQVELLVESQTRLQQNEDNLHKLAYYDPISGLPNRMLLLEKLESTLADPDQQAALLFIDTDNFKDINDSLGHKWGDVLIREAGERLNSMLPKEAMLFRFGGDEFVMLLIGEISPSDLQLLARRLINGFKPPFAAGQGELHLSISIGMALYPLQASGPEELIKNADLALYRAQKQGKSSFVLYDASMQLELQSRMKMEARLLSALDHDEFKLVYQPQVDSSTGRISGFEALLRWENPELGQVAPDKFIQIAEDIRQIIPIGEWVLLTACRFLKKLHNSGYEGYKISVNISVIQLKQEGFVHTMADILQKVDLPAEFLEIEITESLFMESSERNELIAKLDQLRQLGIGIALDDFGTGYSSLDYLRELPITTLKMDKKFVDPIEQDEDSRSLASAILLIGHSLGLKIVAEGVETASQFHFLKTHGCDKIQGYLFSKPLGEAEVAGLLSKWDDGRA